MSRTGEFLLGTSAINMIDGDLETFWSSPPHDFPQSIVITLGARARIDRVGFRSLPGFFGAKTVQFDRSLDGATWQPLATMQSKSVDVAQWLNVPPVEATYLKVTIPDAATPGHDTRLQSILAHGTEVSPRNDPSLAGCWSVNGSAVTFAQHGSRAAGVLALGTQPVFLDGATNGRLWRFNWIRGNDYGLTALTVSPDGKHLSAIEWHEEAIPLFRSRPWFGERSSCSAPGLRDDVTVAVLKRAGHVSLFGLRFDPSGQLLADASREELQSLAKILRAAPPLEIVAHEFRQPDSKRNQEVAQREIDSVKTALMSVGASLEHTTFRAAGSDNPRHVPASDVARAIYSRIEAEVRR